MIIRAAIFCSIGVRVAHQLPKLTVTVRARYTAPVTKVFEIGRYEHRNSKMRPLLWVCAAVRWCLMV